MLQLRVQPLQLRVHLSQFSGYIMPPSDDKFALLLFRTQDIRVPYLSRDSFPDGNRFPTINGIKDPDSLHRVIANFVVNSTLRSVDIERVDDALFSSDDFFFLPPYSLFFVSILSTTYSENLSISPISFEHIRSIAQVFTVRVESFDDQRRR